MSRWPSCRARRPCGAAGPRRWARRRRAAARPRSSWSARPARRPCCFNRASSAVRSGLPGAKLCTGSLTGAGTWVMASNMSDHAPCRAGQRPARARRKNSRLAGRSAIRRVRYGIPGRAEGDVDPDPVTAVAPAPAAGRGGCRTASGSRTPSAPCPPRPRPRAHRRSARRRGCRTRGRRRARNSQSVRNLNCALISCLALLRHLDRLRVGTLDQPDPRLERRQRLQVERSPAQHRLDGQRASAGALVAASRKSSSVSGTRLLSSMSISTGTPGGLRPVQDPAEVRHAGVPVHGLAQLGQLDRDRGVQAAGGDRLDRLLVLLDGTGGARQVASPPHPAGRGCRRSRGS